MQFYIKNLSVWYPDFSENSSETSSESSPETKSIEQSSHNYLTDNANDVIWPKLDFVPPMQRRRLSKFAKIALYVADKTVDAKQNDLPIVFSSRHGDLHRTSELLDDLAHEQVLSPTAFGLSVHNAIPSLYSILTGNQQAVTAIAAGKDSFFMALVDAYARLKSDICNEVLLIHADQDLPQVYSGYQDELQLPHAVAMLISKEPFNGLIKDDSVNSDEAQHPLTCDFDAIKSHEQSYVQTDVQNKKNLPAALAFAQWVKSDMTEFNFNSDNYQWQFYKNV